MLSQKSIRMYISIHTYIHKPPATKDCSTHKPILQISLMEIPLSQPPVNKLLCHEFQSTAVCFAQDGQRDGIVSSLHRSLFSWNNSNPANSEFLQAWLHPSPFVFSRKKADYVFHHNNERFCHSEHFQKENKACAHTGSASFIRVPNPKAPSQQNSGRNKKQELFYTRLGSATPPAAPGEGSGLQQPPAHHWKREFNEERRRVQRIQMSKERQKHLVCYSCWRKKCFLTPQKNQNTFRCCWVCFFFSSFSRVEIRKKATNLPSQKNPAFFSHWTGAKAEGGRKWGGYAKHQNVQCSKWEIF